MLIPKYLSIFCVTADITTITVGGKVTKEATYLEYTDSKQIHTVKTKITHGSKKSKAFCTIYSNLLFGGESRYFNFRS